MNILISGGSGFLGSAFSEWLQTHADAYKSDSFKADSSKTNTSINITWLSRNTDQSHPDYISMMSYDELQVTPSSFDVIINLAGAGIADTRWTESRKQMLFDSRLEPTQAILDYIARISVKPKLLVSGSAIGWYGVQGNTPLDEHSSFETDFAHELCERWEKEAMGAAAFGVEVVIVRTGIVIHPEGGMLARLITPFKLGMGGQLGDGQQIMSWISREDWVRATWFIIERHLQLQSKIEASSLSVAVNNLPKVYNLTAPNPVTNKKFTKAVGHWLHRPTVMTLPAWLLKIMFGEMSTLLVDGQKVLPEALKEAGFEFEYNTLDSALIGQS